MSKPVEGSSSVNASFRPSGDQDVGIWRFALLVRRVASPLPSARIE
jgi:hypothetical protein